MQSSVTLYIKFSTNAYKDFIPNFWGFLLEIYFFILVYEDQNIIQLSSSSWVFQRCALC